VKRAAMMTVALVVSFVSVAFIVAVGYAVAQLTVLALEILSKVLEELK
jgi:hypothetical protein